MMDYSGHMNTGGWILTVLATLILAALAVGVIVWLVSSRTGRSTASPAPPASVREILDRRLASGELTSQQYDELVGRLHDGSAPAAADERPLQPAASD